MCKILKITLCISLGLVILPSCEKTYEEGPAISFRSKMNRITGKWRLVSMEGVDRLDPNTEQYMYLSNEETVEGYYRARFTNFQEEFCSILPDTVGEALFTTDGYWEFYSGAFGAGCDIGEYLDSKEGIDIIINDNSDIMVGTRWKILRLTNKELKIKNNVCINDPCNYYWNIRTLTFEKE